MTLNQEEWQLLLKLVDERLRGLAGRELGGNESALLAAIRNEIVFEKRNAFYRSDEYRNTNSAWRAHKKLWVSR